MDANSKSLYIESFQDLKRISNFEEIGKGELTIFFPFHPNDRSFVDKNDLVHYNIVILPLEIFINNGFKTLIINKSTYFINFLALDSEYNNEDPIIKHIITLNHNNQDKYLVLKPNCHDLIEVIDLSPSSKHYIWKGLFILYYFVVICLILYLSRYIT